MERKENNSPVEKDEIDAFDAFVDDRRTIRNMSKQANDILDSFAVSAYALDYLAIVVNEFYTNTLQFMSHLEMAGFHSQDIPRKIIHELSNDELSSEDREELHGGLIALKSILYSMHDIAIKDEAPLPDEPDVVAYNDCYEKVSKSLGIIVEVVDVIDYLSLDF